MKYFLDCGFNLLIYGIGSKRSLINNFIISYLGNDPVLIINGYHSGTTIKSITNQMMKFVQKYMIHQKCGSNVHDQIDTIKSAFTQYKPKDISYFQRYYIVIHSMEMGQLKNEEWQRYLSELASTKGISMIVTVDHTKAPVLWSDSLLDKFNFYSYELNTFESFDVELDYQAPLFSAKNDN